MQHDIIDEAIESMKEYVPKLVAASEQIAYDIQTHQGGWVATLLTYLEGIAWLTQAIEGIQRLDQYLLEKWDTAFLAPLLDQMNVALEKKDMVSLCDLLQYELQPLLQSYDDELRGIVQ